MRIDEYGNVGIGTTTPSAYLHINPTQTVTTDTTMFKSGIVYNGGSAMTNWYGAYIAAPTGSGTITNKYALVTEAGAGNVGIGTTGPSAGLQIATAGAASAPGELLSGTWYSGGTSTTTMPQLLIAQGGLASSAWNTAGTALGVNSAGTFTGNLLDWKST